MVETINGLDCLPLTGLIFMPIKSSAIFDEKMFDKNRRKESDVTGRAA
jgi:hypothetical protein